MKNWKVFDECTIGEEKFAILVNDVTMEAVEMFWNAENGEWDADFSYSGLKADSYDVAGALDFEGCRKAGYNFLA